jgi:putative oxidoreductase
MRYLVALGRLFYSLIFVVAGFGHFTHQEIAYAAAQGIPIAGVLVPASGIMAIAGGLSILLGFHGKLGAWLLVLFLVPVTFTMHNFWAVKDPMMQQIQMAMFLKNISMLGSALFFTQIGTGPLSLDSRRAPAH